MNDYFAGDIKLTVGPDGSDIQFIGGQPVMDRGLETAAIVSLFTREGWCGNIFNSGDNRIGSDFEETCEKQRNLTVNSLYLIETAARRALGGGDFGGDNTAEASNPEGQDINITLRGGPGGLFEISRRGELWTAQREGGA
jgi:hypothetical protein